MKRLLSLLIICLLAMQTTSNSNSFECKQTLSKIPLNYQSLKVIDLIRDRNQTRSVASRADFDSLCSSLSTQSSGHDADDESIMYYRSPLLKHSLSNATPANGADPKSQEYINVFILDFSVIPGNIVYVDMANYAELINNKLFQAKYVNSTSSGLRLIFNIVTHQFLTIQILNLPPDNKYIREVVFLINGDANIDLLQKYATQNSSRPSVNVLHAPLYDKQSYNQEQQSLPQLNRSDWFEFLLDTFYPNRRQRPTIVYVESLIKICSSFHIRINLESLVVNNYIRMESVGADSYDLVELSELTHDNSNNLVNVCTRHENESSKQTATDLSKNNLVESAADLIGLSKHSDGIDYVVYVFDIENSLVDTKNKYIRIFIKECEHDKNYFLLLYLRNAKHDSFRDKRIMIDDFNCPIKLLVSDYFLFF